MKKKRQRVCKDCGTADVIHANIQEKDVWVIDVMLCVGCLSTRAQLQRIKEDKLPFDKLLGKIRGETAKRIKQEESSVDIVNNLNRYKGPTCFTKLADYWIEQLAYVKEKV